MVFRDQLGRAIQDGDRLVFFCPDTKHMHSCYTEIYEGNNGPVLRGLSADKETGELLPNGFRWDYDGKRCYCAFIYPRFLRRIKFKVWLIFHPKAAKIYRELLSSCVTR